MNKINVKKPMGIKFRSNLEKVAWETWLPTIPHIAAYYEPFSLNTAGGKYTPDFVVIRPDTTLLIVEVKGSWRARGADRSKRILREAAGQYPWLGDYIALLPLKKHTRKGVLTVNEWKIENFNN